MGRSLVNYNCDPLELLRQRPAGLHFVYYNFCKIHKSLTVTPAMEAGLTKRVMSIEYIANLDPIKALIKGVSTKQK